MKIAAHRGNKLHAPENTLNAFISAYTSGADILELDLQLTKDNVLVVSHDGSINRLCAVNGEEVKIENNTLKELRWSDFDFSESFNPNKVNDFKYYRTSKRMQLEQFSILLDKLPKDILKLIELKHDSSKSKERRQLFIKSFLMEINNRKLWNEVIVYSKDKLTIRLIKQLQPKIKVAVFDWELEATAQLKLLTEEKADGLVTDLDSVISEGTLTEFGKELQELFRNNKLKLGAILYPYRKPGVFTIAEFEVLSEFDFIWSLSTDTTLQTNIDTTSVNLAKICNPSYVWLKDDLECICLRSMDDINNETCGCINRDWFSFGYAKYNKYCRVYKKNGIVIDIADYDGKFPKAWVDNETERRLNNLEHRMMYAERTWPFYSGGGFGIINPLVGDFTAIVDYELEQPLSQAQTLEMAVTNVDPARHRNSMPESFRHADAFFDPHGCPPYVGVEHDENDGYRINWNLGTAYDNNQYGPPVGNGEIPVKGSLRLERRESFFSAYYKNDVDAPEWICVGVIQNQTLNQAVFLRCVAKRWLQENSEPNSEFHPVKANKFTFKNLLITKPK